MEHKLRNTKMQFLVLCLCAFAFTVAQDIESMQNMPKYDSRYDYLDVDAVFNSKRLVINYIDCLLNGRKCTPEGKVLKKLLPEALRTKCVRCTERQKRTAVKIIRRLKAEYPAEWARLQSKWDPSGDFTRYFEVFLANEHFNAIPNGGFDLPAPTLAPRTTTPPTTTTAATPSTPPQPLLLNRFGDDGDLIMGSPTSAVATPRPIVTSTTMRPPTTMRPVTTMRPATAPTRFTPVSWDTPAASNMKPMKSRPNDGMMTTPATFFDHISYKIIRTTELITDILKNTVRAVIGR